MAANKSTLISTLAVVFIFIIPGAICLNFVLDPTDQISREFTPCWFHCMAIGGPSVLYTWLFNNYPITGPNYQIYANGTLLIRNVTQMNVGTYSCLAEAGEDSLQSQIAVLTLAYLSNSFSVHPTSHIQSMGDIVHLQCSIDSSPPPSISWYYNGQPLSDGGVVTSTTLSVLRLGPLEHQQMGVYSCLATNALLPGQQRMSNPATLTILGRPGFITTPSAQSIAVGGTAIFLCETISMPAASIDWINQYEQIIRDSGRFRVSENQLEISDVEKLDEGYYTCRASNNWGSNTAAALLTVQDAMIVTFTRRPSDQTVSVGSRVTFPCEADGNPSPSIMWSKQNSNLPEGRTEEPAPGWLRILDIELSDSGIYVCSASNIHGTVTAAVRLNVQAGNSGRVAPSFVTEPVSHTVEAGSPVTMTCTVTGVPDPYVTWLTPNNVVYEVPSGEMNGISVSSDGIFYINNANINDAGVYTCTATNAVGTVYTTATLDVLSMPTFTYSQENQRVNEGTSILLKCRADGNPKPTMSWFYNGIQLETNAQYDVYFSGDLRIHNIEKTQDGIYVCRAENTMGSIQHAVYIIILVAPTFMLRPLDLIVDLGSTVMINCTADGFPAPVLEWQKDGQVLSVDYNVHVFGNHTIKIDGVQEMNLGAYTCIASNEAGHNRVTGNLWTTDIPVFGIKPYNTSVNISESVTLQCQAHSREPAVITWYRSDFHANKHYQIGDGFVHLTTPGANSYVTGSGDLVVLDARKIDAGWYLCEAANSVGVITGTLYLTINMPPEIYYVTSPLRGTEGGMAYLQCYSYGTPKPDITWNDQDGELIEPLLGRYDITANSLLIHSLSMLDDSGNYTCHASNMLGDDLAVLTLFIQGLPVLDGITVTHDDVKKTIICHSLGLPEPSISWKVNDIPLNQNNILGHDVNRDYELVIYNFVAVETFMYYCWATNIFGNSTDVYVISVPKDPSLPSVIGLTASTVTLSWEDQNTLDALPTLSYNIQSKAASSDKYQGVIDGITTLSYTVEDLVANTAYIFRVQAVNAFGAGAFSDPSVVVTTMQGAPSVPLDVTGVATSDYILLTWNAAEELNASPDSIYYDIRYIDLNSTDSEEVVLQYRHDNQPFVIQLQDVEVGHLYKISMRTVNYDDVTLHSDDVIIYVRTVDSAPLKAVDNLQITAKGTSSVLLTWQVDNIDSSLISGYVVSYRAAGNDTFTSVQLSSSSITSYVLQDLDTDTEYFIKIAYYTSGGIGPYTEEVLVKTEADLFDPSGNQSLSDDSSMSASTLGAIIGAMLAVALLLLLLAVILCRSYRSPKDEQLYARKNSNIWIASDNLYEEGASGSATKQGVYNISFASNDNYHPDDGTDGMYDFSGAAGQKRSKRGKFNVRAMTSDVMFKKRGKAPLRRWGIPETSGVILTSQTSTSEVAPVSTPITAVSHDLRNETITEVSEENGSAARQAMSASRDGNSPTPSSISHQYEYIDTSPTPRPIQKDAVYAKVEKTGKINMKIQEEQERRRKILAERERQKELDKGLRIISKEKKKEARRREKLRASADGSEDPPVNIQEMHMRNRENAALY